MRLCRPALFVAALLVLALGVLLVLVALDDDGRSVRRPAPGSSASESPHSPVPLRTQLGDTQPMPEPHKRLDGPYKPFQATPRSIPRPVAPAPRPQPYRLSPMAR